MSWPKWRRHLCLLFFLYWFVRCSNPVTQQGISEASTEATSVSEDAVFEKVNPSDNTEYERMFSTPSLASSYFTDNVISDNIDTNSLVITPAVAPATPWDDFQLSSMVEDTLSDKIEQQKATDGTDEVIESDKTQKVTDKENYESSDEIIKDKEDIDRKNVNLNETKPADVSTSEKILSQGGHIDEKTHELTEDVKIDKTDDNSDQDIKKKESQHIPENDSSTAQNEGISGLSEESQETNEMMDGNSDESQSQANEDMPSFKEWSEKFLAQEEEKNKEQHKNDKGSAEASSTAKKKTSGRKQNNYASVDCGAKILEKNVEARNAESILLENKDMYMLNPCSANISFIVELCDHVHVTSLHLANFEMFSSTTEKFQVSFSTRYPSREWKQLQIFTAKSEKVVQTFTLDPIFAKYMKVEQLSHHGSEHYCPWSLLRVYGNSMVEEYEEQEHDSESSVEQEDESLLSDSIEEQHDSNGILHTATEVVFNFVKETAKKLVTTPGANDSSNANDTNATSSSNAENQKAIVQLMDRADFEADFCQDGMDESSSRKCGSEINCGLTKSTADSFKLFFEIVYNVCHHDRKLSQACLTNLNLTNKTTGEDFKPDQDKNIVVKMEATGEEMPSNDSSSENSEIHENSEELGASDKVDKVEVKSNLDSSSVIGASAESRHYESSSPSTAPIIASSHSSSTGSSSTSTPSRDVEFPPSPTPLAQPPLAVDPKPPGPNHNIIYSDHDVSELKENTSISSSSTEPSSEPAQTTAVTTSGSEQNISAQTTVSPSESSVTADPASVAAREVESSVVEQSVKGAGDEQMNRHVDVLKIRLTDDTTKEGTAELEASDGDISIEESKADTSVMHVADHVTPPSESRNYNDVTDGDEFMNDVSDKSETKHDSSAHKTGEEETNTKEGVVKEKEFVSEDDSKKKREESERIDEELDVLNTRNDDAAQLEMKNKYLPSAAAKEMCDQKDYEGQVEQNQVRGGPVTSEGATDPAQNTPVQNGEQNNKKESVFVAMSRKIKGLEQNVTMTNLFLEELSQRYRKSIEEMQKKMEKKLTGVSKNLKFLSNVNSYQNSTIALLTSKVEELERDLKQAKQRLQLINQEVIERHLLGMCLQFTIILVLFWLLMRRLQPTKHVNNAEYLSLQENATVPHGNDHVFDETEKDKISGSIEEFKLPKTPELLTENKRRRRRRQRSGTADHLLVGDTNIDQNIMTRTAGLIFHTPGCHPDENLAIKHEKAAQYSVSLHDVGRTSPEHRTTRRPTSHSTSPRKAAFRQGGKNAGSKTRLFDSEDSKLTNDDTQCEYKGRLLKAKSLDGNEVTLCSNALSSCSLESGKTQLPNSKGRWIWGLG